MSKTRHVNITHYHSAGKGKGTVTHATTRTNTGDTVAHRRRSVAREQDRDPACVSRHTPPQGGAPSGAGAQRRV